MKRLSAAVALLLLSAGSLLPQAAHKAPASRSSPVAGLGLDGEKLRQIPIRLKAFVDQGEIAGAVVLAARRGELALLEAIGYQDLEARKPMQPDTIFQIMSMTKPFVGVGIMMLAEEGKLTLNDPVEKHLPEFRGQMVAENGPDGTRRLRKPSRPITIRDLMTHTSGMSGSPPPSAPDILQRLHLRLADAVLLYAQQPLEFDPNTQWRYSNMGIAVLGRIIEVISGQPFERFLAERILNPLGMKDSFIFPPADKTSRIAAVYRKRDGKLVKAGSEILGGDPLQFRRGAVYSMPEAGLYSTAADLRRFYQMMLNGGILEGRRYLSRASVELMTAVHTGHLTSGHNPGTAFGLTWEVVKDITGAYALLSPGTFKHGGAFGTHGWVDPKKEIVGVFLIQRADDDRRPRDVFMQMLGAAVMD